MCSLFVPIFVFVLIKHAQCTWICNSFDTDTILRYDAKTGAFRNAFVPRGSGGLDGPTSIVFVKDIPEPTSGVAILAFIFVGALNIMRRKHQYR